MKFTDRQLKSIKPGNIRKEISDESGLSVRITPKGKIVFQYRYMMDKKRYRFDIGEYPIISLADARTEFFRLKGMISQGQNPVEVKRLNRVEKLHEPTLEQLAEEFYQRYLLKNHKQPDFSNNLLMSNVLPYLGIIKVKEIKRRDLIHVLDKIIDRGSPILANRTLTVVKKMFNYGIGRGFLEENPAALITRSEVGGQEESRDRYFTFDEITSFFEKIESAPFSRQIQLILLIQLFTGQRLGEITGAECSEVDFEKRIWLIPKEKSKNKEKQEVYLTNKVLDAFKELYFLARGSKWVCASPIEIEQPIRFRSVDKAVRRNLEYFGLEKWTPHDLRRTVSTQLNEIGIPPYIVEKVLNHKLQGVMAVYNRAEYAEEKKRAWESWEKQLLSLRKEGKVIS